MDMDRSFLIATALCCLARRSLQTRHLSPSALVFQRLTHVVYRISNRSSAAVPLKAKPAGLEPGRIASRRHSALSRCSRRPHLRRFTQDEDPECIHPRVRCVISNERRLSRVSDCTGSTIARYSCRFEPIPRTVILHHAGPSIYLPVAATGWPNWGIGGGK